MECEYQKYGCAIKVANADHAQAHIHHHAPAHARLLAQALDTEIEKNKALTLRVVSLEKAAKENQDKYNKLEELESRFRALQNLVESKLEEQYYPPTTGGKTIPASFVNPSSALSSSSGERVPSSIIRSASPGPSPAPSSKSDTSRSFNPTFRPPSRSDSPSVPSVPVKEGLSKDAVIGKDAGPRPTAPSRSISSVALRDIDIKEKRALTHSATEFVPDKHTTDPGYDEARSLTMEDLDGYEKGVLWDYDPKTQEWSRGVVSFRIEKTAFAAGALRGAYKVVVKESLSDASEFTPEASVLGDKKIKKGLPSGFGDLGTKYVAKISKNKVAVERYFEDVKMQLICLELGKKFNEHRPPKKVQFLHAWVLEMPNRSPPVYCGLEPYVEGEFVKLSNNYGAVLSDRNTPAALSHFSWENTNHLYLVIDIQGVKDFYTDPQIHTKDGKGFGLGNLGMNGIERFLKTHKCNAICQMLGLPLINQAFDTKKKTVMKGTMKVPFIEDQLGPADNVIKWETGCDPSAGEFQCVQTLTGHEDRVTSLCVTTKHLIAGCASGDLRVYNLGTLTVHMNVNAHRKVVSSIVANEKYVFTASDDHSVKAWTLDNFENAGQLRDHLGEVNALCLSDKTLGYLISASFDKNIKVWSTRTLKCVTTLEGHTKSIKTLGISGSILFSGSNDGNIMIWSLKYMSCLFQIEAHGGWVKSMAVKDRSLFSGSFDYLIKEWDIVTFNHLNTITAHNDDVLAVLPTDKFLISASNDRSIILWDYNSKKVIANLRGHRSGVQSLATDGKVIFSGSDDYNVKVWKYVEKR